MAPAELWVGAVGAVHVVHDSRLKVDSVRWVALFLVPYSRLELYTRWHARSAARTIPVEDEAHAFALSAYESFSRGLSPAVIEGLRVEALRRDAAFEARLAKIVERHRARLQELELPNRGVREPAKHDGRRESVCYVCDTGVDSAFSPACESCGWIVCGNCGACGCGWHPNNGKTESGDRIEE